MWTSDQYVQWLLHRQKEVMLICWNWGFWVFFFLFKHVFHLKGGCSWSLGLQAWWLMPNTARRFMTSCRRPGLDTAFKTKGPSALQQILEASSLVSCDFPSVDTSPTSCSLLTRICRPSWTSQSTPFVSLMANESFISLIRFSLAFPCSREPNPTHPHERPRQL